MAWASMSVLSIMPWFLLAMAAPASEAAHRAEGVGRIAIRAQMVRVVEAARRRPQRAQSLSPSAASRASATRVRLAVLPDPLRRLAR